MAAAAVEAVVEEAEVEEEEEEEEAAAVVPAARKTTKNLDICFLEEKCRPRVPPPPRFPPVCHPAARATMATRAPALRRTVAS